MKGFSRVQLRNIGFEFIMENLETQTVYGRDIKNNLQPFARDKIGILKREIRYLDDFMAFHEANPYAVNGLASILHRFKEIRGIVKKLENESDVLDEVELYEIKNFALNVSELCNLYDTIDFDFDSIAPISLDRSIELLNPHGIITPSFHISELYSEKLAKIRKSKAKIESDSHSEEFAKRRNAIIHDEKKEELEVKKILTIELRKDIENFKKNIVFIGKLDFLIAKAMLHKKFGGSKPIWADSNHISIDSAVNPYVDYILSKSGKSFVPISLGLQKGANILTGANMGGKSVALATVTLNVLLAHCGFFVFAEKFETPFIDFIFYLSEDYQSVNEGLSTFGAEIKEISKALEMMKDQSGLCVLDEFAKGTNPEEGEIIVRAFARYCEESSSNCFISTHYSDVVEKGMKHLQVIGLKNAKFDELLEQDNIRPSSLQELMDFRIEKVKWNSQTPKDAVRVAELMGIQREFIDLIKNVREERSRDRK
ncbi:MAG: MutS-related protein [Candidatus Zixiibacteriota bacterium]